MNTQSERDEPCIKKAPGRKPQALSTNTYIDALAAMVPVGVLFFDPTTYACTFVNDEALRIVGLDSKVQSVLQKILTDIYAIDSGYDVREAPLTIACHDAYSVSVMANARLIAKDKGQPAMVVTTLRECDGGGFASVAESAALTALRSAPIGANNEPVYAFRPTNGKPEYIGRVVIRPGKPPLLFPKSTTLSSGNENAPARSTPEEKSFTATAAILAFDADPQFRRYVHETLSADGHTVSVVGDFQHFLSALRGANHDLILLDMDAIGRDEKVLHSRLSKKDMSAIILMSCDRRGLTIERAFALGADDFMQKPFLPSELSARVNAALRARSRRDGRDSASVFESSGLRIDYANRSVTLYGNPITLTATEYRLLTELSVNAGRTLTHDHLLLRVWGDEYVGNVQVLRTYITYLRGKLRGCASLIVTEPRVGYKLG